MITESKCKIGCTLCEGFEAEARTVMTLSSGKFALAKTDWRIPDEATTSVISGGNVSGE